MLLDLTQIRQPETELTRRYEPSAFEGRTTDVPRRRARGPAADGPQGQGSVSPRRDRVHGAGAARAAAVSSRFSCRSTATFDLRYLPQAANTGETSGKSKKTISRKRSIATTSIDLGQLMEEQFYLALPMKPLCRARLQGPVPELRHQPERRDVRLPGALGGSAAGGPEGADRPEQRRCLIQNDATRRRAAASAAPTTRCPRRPPATARSAASPRPRTSCASTAASTTSARFARSTRSSVGQGSGSGIRVSGTKVTKASDPVGRIGLDALRA